MPALFISIPNFAELPKDGIDHAFNVVFARAVGLNGNGATTHRAYRFDHFVSLVLAFDVVDGDVGPFVGKG